MTADSALHSFVGYQIALCEMRGDAENAALGADTKKQ
jgi:hypothetical protein